MNAMDSWLYGGDPLMHIKYEHAIENVKKSLNTNHFEELIKKYMLDNTHASLLTLKPEKGLAQREENELKEILQKLRDLDYEYKNGLIDLQVGLESILCRYCS